MIVLQNFLEQKPLYYDEIDYTRMPRIYERIKHALSSPKIIHLIGTNGKGTTGRFLASALFALGFTVGHYSSPHIVKFNERIWINGEEASDEMLEKAHQELLALLTEDEANALSYFEYTTLLAICVYKDMEYVVLEAGLGGEHDATAVFENILTLITPIAKDHEAFLGETLKEITTTKVNAVQKVAILGHQPNSIVETVAREIVTTKNSVFHKMQELLNDEDTQNIRTIQKELFLEEYLVDNLSLAIATLKYLQIPYTSDSFKNARLFGRLSKLGENIIVDVGHNVLAARAIKNALAGNKYSLIYNSYKDKNYREIIEILKPIVKDIQIIKVDDKRIEKQDILEETLSQLGVKYQNFNGIEDTEQYLVFGSFSVLEAFLKAYNE